MKRSVTGTYEVTAVGGETVRAFIPHPLPPQPGLDLSGPVQPLLERALLALGRLDSLSTLLPETDLFLYSYVRKEAVLSSQIEGTQSSLSDLLLFEIEQAPGAPLDSCCAGCSSSTACSRVLARCCAMSKSTDWSRRARATTWARQSTSRTRAPAFAEYCSGDGGA